jgi:hypothetical protein
MSVYYERFVADNAQDGTPLVLDTAHWPCRVVVGCDSDEQAERIAKFLKGEFPRSVGRGAARVEATGRLTSRGAAPTNWEDPRDS